MLLRFPARIRENGIWVEALVHSQRVRILYKCSLLPTEFIRKTRVKCCMSTWSSAHFAEFISCRWFLLHLLEYYAYIAAPSALRSLPISRGQQEHIEPWHVDFRANSCPQSSCAWCVILYPLLNRRCWRCKGLKYVVVTNVWPMGW